MGRGGRARARAGDVSVAAMKQIYTTRVIEVPEGVTVDVNAKYVKVTGPRGSLERSLKHMNVDLYKLEEDGAVKIKVDLWYGSGKKLAAARTAISHITNMFLGVTR